MDTRGCREAGEQLKYSYHQKQRYKKLTIYSTTPSNVRSMYCNSVSHSAKTAYPSELRAVPATRMNPAIASAYKHTGDDSIFISVAACMGSQNIVAMGRHTVSG